MCLQVLAQQINHCEERGSVLLQPPYCTQGHNRPARSLDTKRHVLPSIGAESMRPIEQKIVEKWQQKMRVLGHPENVPACGLRACVNNATHCYLREPFSITSSYVSPNNRRACGCSINYNNNRRACGCSINYNNTCVHKCYTNWNVFVYTNGQRSHPLQSTSGDEGSSA